MNLNTVKLEYIIISLTMLLLGFLLVVLLRKKSSSVPESEKLGIQELIQRLKIELADSEKLMRKRGDDALFQLKSVELEINFAVRERRSAEGGFSYEVITIGGESEISNEKTQKITLNLDVIPATTDSVSANPELIPD